MLALQNKSSFPTLNAIHHCDFFVLCGAMEDASVDMILCDLPYGTTACNWDNRIPLETMWSQFKRIIKPRGAIVLTASQPFTSMLVMSNIDWFRDEVILEKSNATRFLDANRRPMKSHENILVFGKSLPNYYPQMETGAIYKAKNGLNTGAYLKGRVGENRTINDGTRYPKTVVRFATRQELKLHPTEKSTALFEYLIRTYTREGDLVFDPCVGSGTTAVAAKNTGRNYICGDIMSEYVDIARKRVNPVFGQPPKRKREVLPLNTLPLFAAGEV